MIKNFFYNILIIVVGLVFFIIYTGFADNVFVHASQIGVGEGTDLDVAATLSLEKAFELALANNPGLKVSEAERTAARQSVSKARSRFMPNVNIRETYVRSDNPVQVFSAKLAQQNFQSGDFAIQRLNYPSLHNNISSQIILTQPLFNRGSEFADYKNATYYEQISRASESQTRQKVLLDTETAFLGWLLAIDAHKVMVKTVETAEANLKITDSRFEADTVLKSDVLQSEVHLASLRKEALGTKNAVAIACSNLNLAMGLAPEGQWQAVSPDFSGSNEQKDLHYWNQKALDNRPERAYAALQRDIARMTVKKYKMNFLPALNFNGIYEYASEGTHGASGDNVTVMVTADFNIFNGLGDCAEFKKARAEELKAQAMEKDIEQNIRNEVHKAWLNLTTAREQVTVTQKAVAQAREGLRIVQERYKSGLTIITELLNSETALSRAQLEHLRALYDCQLAHAELKWAAGVLNAEERSL
jgi:outer membrane protein TolC